MIRPRNNADRARIGSNFLEVLLSTPENPSKIAQTLLDTWRSRGAFHDIFGHRVFCCVAGPEDAEPLLLLHGFPTSSLDFHRVIDTWAQRYRVVVHDHLGFGFSDKPANYSYSLVEQAEVAVELWRRLGIPRGHLLGHDYGTSVATELLARRERDLLPVDFSSVTLANGSAHIEMSKLRLSQKIARSPLGPLFGRLVTRGYFIRVMARLWGDRRRIHPGELDAMWDAISVNQGQHRTHELSRYIGERYRYWHRWIGALERLDLPAHVLWGCRDPVAVPAIAEQLAREIPGAKLTWFDDLGHYPMLEEPEDWGAAAMAFWDEGVASAD